MSKSYLAIPKGNILKMEQDLNKDQTIKYVILNDQLATLYVSDDFEEKNLNNIKSIAWWQRSAPMSTLIEITNNVKQGQSVTIAAGTDYVYTNPYLTLSGKKNIIVIIDSGIDYFHPDFINEDGTSKIIAIWDQNLDIGKHPEGIFFGTEFKGEEINKAIKNKDDSLTKDTIGTGTIAAGICSGYGNKIPEYKGAAIDSELLVIKLKEYKNTYREGKINYQQSDFLAAIKYAIDIWKKQDNQMIINLTVGLRSASIMLATFLDSFSDLKQSGIIVVGGAGNEGNTDIHYEGNAKGPNDNQDIIIQVGEQINLDIVLCTTGPDKIGATLISPSGELSYIIQYSPEYYLYRGRFNIEDTKYEMRFVYPWLETGNQELVINLIDIKPGIWTLRILPEYIVNGNYDVYLPNKNLISPETRFIDPNSSSTITLCATTENIITIGCYNDKTDSIWIGSSKGPVKNRMIKPDIVAPGVDIISTFKNATYNTATGTGVSTSIVCGVVSLLVEYFKTQSFYSKTSLFTETIKTYLMLGASKKDIYKYPNISEGYGNLDLKQTIIQIANNLE